MNGKVVLCFIFVASVFVSSNVTVQVLAPLMFVISTLLSVIVGVAPLLQVTFPVPGFDVSFSANVNEVLPILPTTWLVGAFIVTPTPCIVTVYPSVKSTTHVVGRFGFVRIIVFFSSSQYPSALFVHVTLFIM